MDESATQRLSKLLEKSQTVILGSVSKEGTPDASYAPVILSEQGKFYIYISTMARHTNNLRVGKKCSAMMIEDEASAAQLFARQRVTYQCVVEEVKRDSEKWLAVMSAFTEKFGDIMSTLQNMLDFHLLELQPIEGRLVLGFGEAYQFRGLGTEKLSHIQGVGHKMKK